MFLLVSSFLIDKIYSLLVTISSIWSFYFLQRLPRCLCIIFQFPLFFLIFHIVSCLLGDHTTLGKAIIKAKVTQNFPQGEILFLMLCSMVIVNNLLKTLIKKDYQCLGYVDDLDRQEQYQSDLNQLQTTLNIVNRRCKKAFINQHTKNTKTIVVSQKKNRLLSRIKTTSTKK